LRPDNKPATDTPSAIRYRAAAMDLAAFLDEQYVEMRIVTDTGATVTIVCDKDSIFSIQRHIEKMGRACPEISTWTPPGPAKHVRENDKRSYDAAMSEGWPASQRPLQIP